MDLARSCILYAYKFPDAPLMLWAVNLAVFMFLSWMACWRSFICSGMSSKYKDTSVANSFLLPLTRLRAVSISHSSLSDGKLLSLFCEGVSNVISWCLNDWATFLFIKLAVFKPCCSISQYCIFFSKYWGSIGLLI